MINISKEAIITVGAPGSGKSTFAKKLIESNPDKNWISLDRDSLRRSILKLDESENLHTHWHSLDPKTRNKYEKDISDYMQHIIKDQYLDDISLIIPNTNLTKSHRESLIHELMRNGFKVTVEIFNPRLFDLRVHNKMRVNVVRESVIVDFWYRLLYQFDSIIEFCEKESHNVSVNVHGFYKNHYMQKKPNCVIVDLDGTLAHNDHGRDWFSDEVGEDRFDDIIFTMASSVAKRYNADLIFLTGRKCSAFYNTSEWLSTNIEKYYGGPNKVEINEAQLYMRTANDNRKDAVVKKEIFESVLDNYSNVIAVFDDRPSVVDLWHDLGLKVIACGDYRNNF